MKRLLALICVAVTLLAGAARAQAPSTGSHILLVLPFDNDSKAPGLEWIGESFPEIVGQRLKSGAFYPISRDDRLYAFDRLGVPAAARLTRATLLRVAGEMDADYVVFGKYEFDGKTFTGTAQLMDMARLHLSPAVSESGPLTDLMRVENSLAWDLARQLDPLAVSSRDQWVAASSKIRLDAFENYIRGALATSPAEKIKRYREAVRLSPDYTTAMVHLGEAYYESKDYADAVTWLSQVPPTDTLAPEANFYLGLASFYSGNYPRAEQAFQFVAERLPLTEVLNNLGVAAGRQGKRSEREYFERASQNDPNEPDYHFNLGVALSRAGDRGGAEKQLREALRLNPADSEARSLLESMGANGAGAVKAAARLPMERVKVNYDETSFRQLAMEIENVAEMRLSKMDARSHAAYHVERGQELISQGLAGEAEKNFREAVELDPTNAGAHSGLAQILESRGAFPEARAEAKAAVRLQPSAAAFVVLGRLDLRDNNVEAAAQEANAALALDPSSAAAQALKRDAAARSADKP